MGATRLPGKVMKQINGEPILGTLFHRLSTTKLVDATVLATSLSPDDDRVAEFANKREIPCYRGPEADVLDRFVGAADEFGAATVVRVCADNPLISGHAIDKAVAKHQSTDAEYTKTRRLPTPVEIVDSSVIRSINHKSISDEEREHVTLHILNNPDNYKIETVDYRIDTNVRLTVDYPEDLHMYRKLAHRLGPPEGWSLSDVVAYLEANEDERRINKSVDELPPGWQSRPEITVMIRTYNSQETVSRAIESALNQTIDHELYEVLVIDDGSNDGTEGVVREYVETMPQVVRLVKTPHEGAMRTFNQGVEEALGKYVTLLDSDDTAEPKLLKRLYDVLESNLSISFSYCNYYERTADGDWTRVDVSDDIFKTVASGIMFRKEVLFSLGGYSEELIFPEYDLLLKCQRNGLVGEHVEEFLLRYYRHEQSLTADAERVKKGKKQLWEKYGYSFTFRDY
jgi:spore coat polysaccharide biosynthesis protein SpsF